MACAGVGIQARLGIGPFVMSGDLGDMRHAQRLLVDALKRGDSLKSLALGNAADAKHWKQRADDLEGVLKDIIIGPYHNCAGGEIFMNLDDIPEYRAMRKGLMCLRLEVDSTIADDLLSRCEKAIHAVRSEAYQRGRAEES